MAVTYTSTYTGPAKFHGDTADTDHPNYPEVCKLNDAIGTSIQTALTAGFGANGGTLKAAEDRVATLEGIAANGGTLDLRVDALEAKGLIVFAKGIAAEDNSTGVTAGTNETAFTNLVQIPSGTLAVGDRIRVTAKVGYVSDNGGDTVALALKFAAAAGLAASTCDLALVAAVDAATGAWFLTADVRVVAIGAASTAEFEGVGTSYKCSAAPAFLATELNDHTSVATNAIIDVGVTYTWNGSNANNVVRLKECFVTVIRPSA